MIHIGGIDIVDPLIDGMPDHFNGFVFIDLRSVPADQRQQPNPKTDASQSKLPNFLYFI